MKSKVNIGVKSGNTYASEEWRVKEFEDIYSSSPSYYANWFVTCRESVRYSGDKSDTFKAGVAYRIHDKSYDPNTHKAVAFEISDGTLNHWVNSCDMQRYFKSSIDGHATEIFNTLVSAG